MQLTNIQLEALINAPVETTIILFDNCNLHSEVSVGYGRAYTFHDTNLTGVEFKKMQNASFKEFKNPLDLLEFACYASDEDEE